MSHDSLIPREIPFRTLERGGAVLAVALLLIVLGVAAVFLTGEPARLWSGLLFNWLFWSALAMGMVVFAVALHITDASWAWSLRRFALAGAAFLPVSFVLMPIITYFGREHLFHHWLHAEGDPVIDAKRAWLNLPGLMARDLIAVGILYALALAFVYFSLRPDLRDAGGQSHRSLYGAFTGGWRGAAGEARHSKRMLNRLAPLLALLYAVVFGIVAIDLAMSLAPHWFSTMFPVAYFVTGFHGALAAVAIAATLLRRPLGIEEFIAPRQYHDLGKLVFAFSVFWMYLNWSQYIVIWYGQLPFEQEYFARRLGEPFGAVASAVVLLVFLLPFFGLLTRPPKKVPGVLAFFSVLILVGHWLERYLLVVPSLYEGAGHGVAGGAAHAALPLGLPEIGLGLGFLGVFVALYLWFLRTFPVLPSAAMVASEPDPLAALPATSPRPAAHRL